MGMVDVVAVGKGVAVNEEVPSGSQIAVRHRNGMKMYRVMIIVSATRLQIPTKVSCLFPIEFNAV